MDKMKNEKNNDYNSLHGAQTRDRTTDTRIFSPLLYQLSYLGTLSYFQPRRVAL